MPELPEVETIRRDLEKEVVGKRIKQVEVSGLRSIRRHTTKKQFTARLEGRKVVGVDRRGKYLLVKLEGGDDLVIHLGMSGQLLWSKAGKEEKAKHTHVMVTFAPAGQLRFLDPRTFGELFVTAADEVDAAVPELAHLGFDPVEQAISWTHFGELLHARKRKLKDLLMDQRFIAGIGNLYSDEILWGAGLRHDRTSDDLTSQEIRRLYRSMSEILHDAIKHRGSSLADEQYRDLYGAVGGYAGEHNVYDREGQPCRRCRTPIVRMKYGGRSHFFCERCQI
ncbi:MAG TPA: bifunctional DNA-formamidopyrimidine glycosylase/DNA-(apurinic or apyrimidinic site) lyase [Acidimicrobiales bacterium]|nr:bifunctional DNA-formamidopyrimidine glycosylase/DNA-(apurinic or apyrimidinic site) lyase [Acidimicrobiales bacterium]